MENGRKLPKYLNNLKMVPDSYDVGPRPLYGDNFLISDRAYNRFTDIPARRVRIVRTSYKKNTWAVRDSGNCLNKDLEWEMDGFSSDRTAEYLERTRFASAEEAFEYYKKYLDQVVRKMPLWHAHRDHELLPKEEQ